MAAVYFELACPKFTISGTYFRSPFSPDLRLASRASLSEPFSFHFIEKGYILHLHENRGVQNLLATKIESVSKETTLVNNL